MVADAALARAFRLDRHNLVRRLPGGSLLTACGACGIQDSPPGSAAIALGARVDGLRLEDLEEALGVTKTLVRLWSVRAAPHVVPTDQAGVFTTGLRPEDEQARMAFIGGAASHLSLFGLTATEALELTESALIDALDGRELTKDDLGRELAAVVGRSIAAEKVDRWNEPDGMGRNRYGESLCRWALNLVALDGVFLLGAGRDVTTFVRADQWLGRPVPVMEPAAARAEILHRYLRCYGPSTIRDFASWAGIALSQAEATWQLARDGLTEVRLGRRSTWLLQADVGAFGSPPEPKGIRLLPPHDAYLQQRDRDTVLPDKTRHREVWRAQGAPGVILADGAIQGIWRPQKRGSRLTVSVKSFAPGLSVRRTDIESEAIRIGPLRACGSTEVRFVG